MNEDSRWRIVRYVRPSRRRSPELQTMQETLVLIHKRRAATGRRHCRGCGAFLSNASVRGACAPCTRRSARGDKSHWWAGLKGREKRQPKPMG